MDGYFDFWVQAAMVLIFVMLLAVVVLSGMEFRREGVRDWWGLVSLAGVILTLLLSVNLLLPSLVSGFGHVVWSTIFVLVALAFLIGLYQGGRGIEGVPS
jgi:hypothetical protein